MTGIEKEIFSSLEYTSKKSIYSCDVKFGFYVTRKRRLSVYRESSLYIQCGFMLDSKKVKQSHYRPGQALWVPGG